jgi:hypothetical protein
MTFICQWDSFSTTGMYARAAVNIRSKLCHFILQVEENKGHTGLAGAEASISRSVPDRQFSFDLCTAFPHINNAKPATNENITNTMSHHSAAKPNVSDDEALAVLALTHLDRGTSAGESGSGNNGKDFDKKPTAPKSSAAARAHAAAPTTTSRKSPANTAVRRNGKSKPGVPNAVPIQTIPKRGNYVNHSYVDYSADTNDQNYRLPESLEDMTFAEKLHVVLSTPEYQHCISWLPHGRAFRVNVPVFFEKTVCPKFFGHKRFSSFLRQLNNHGFKHLTSGSSRNGYYHEVRYHGRCCSCCSEPLSADRFDSSCCCPFTRTVLSPRRWS